MGSLLSTTTRVPTTATIINNSDTDVKVTPFMHSVAQEREIMVVKPQQQLPITILGESLYRTYEIDKLEFKIKGKGMAVQAMRINGADRNVKNLRFTVAPVSYKVTAGVVP